MNAEKDDDEKLEDYAVDVRELRGVHEHLVAKRSQIEVLIAEERKPGSGGSNVRSRLREPKIPSRSTS